MATKVERQHEPVTPLQELTFLVTPPTNPTAVGTPDRWTKAEQALGTSLPSDYKTLVDTYGVGRFADWISLYSPFATVPRFNIQRRRDSVARLYHESFVIRPEDMPPYPPFPEAGYLLPWAGDDNGDEFCWVTIGPPDEWKVVNLDSHYTQEDYRPLGVTATELLAGWFAGRITGDWYPEDVGPTRERYFLPNP